MRIFKVAGKLLKIFEGWIRKDCMKQNSVDLKLCSSKIILLDFGAKAFCCESNDF